MTMTMRMLLVAGALALATPVLAQNVPPANGLPLSQILAELEKTQPVRAFLEVEWEDDGYWDITFLNTNNRRNSMRIDPFSGGQWKRFGG